MNKSWNEIESWNQIYNEVRKRPCIQWSICSIIL